MELNKNGLQTAGKVIALGFIAAVAATGLAGVVNANAAEASSGHRFPNPGGGTHCKGWLNFAPASDWGAGGIVVKRVSCKTAKRLITRWAKYGQDIPWSYEVRAHDKGLAHGDVRLRQGRAVIVFQSY